MLLLRLRVMQKKFREICTQSYQWRCRAQPSAGGAKAFADAIIEVDSYST